jgi:hypothetical protein
MTNGWPNALVSFSATIRSGISSEFPGPSGMTILTGLDG